MSGRRARPRDFEADRRRNRLLIGVVLLVVLLAVIAYFAFRSDGEDTRSAYCAKVKTFTAAGGLEAGLRAADRAGLDAITALAPRTVTTAWSDASTYVLARDPSTAPGFDAAAAKFESDIEVIKQDAADNCSLRIRR